ncbi:MAG: glycosyltransferase [Faecousia sp.]
MKITFFIGHMGYGGAERVISLLANDYCRRGWDTDIVMLLSNDLAQKLEPGVRLVDLSLGGGSYGKRALRWMKEIRGYLKREKPDCVVSFIGRINALVLTAALGLKLPVIVSERNDPRHDGRGKGMLTYCDTLYRTARAVVFQTKAEQECFSDAVKAKGVIIPNPVSVEGAVRRESEDFRVVTAGRLAEQKNHKMLMDAMVLVSGEIPEARCTIYGEGELRSELETYVREKGLEDTVSMPGHALDIHEKIADASVFVLTSEYEGLPNALIEAMMLGIPCVTTDYPGAEEVMTDGLTGLIVPRGDDKELARKLVWLAQNREAGSTLGNNARQEAEKYRTENVIRQWRKVIEE